MQETSDRQMAQDREQQMEEISAHIQRAYARSVAEQDLEEAEKLSDDDTLEAIERAEWLEANGFLNPVDSRGAMTTVIDSLARRIDVLEEEVSNLRMAMTDHELGGE